MNSKPAYCPNCNAELELKEIEPYSLNLVWKPCNTPWCRVKHNDVKTDPSGFILDPSYVRGRYIYNRTSPPLKERHR